MNPGREQSTAAGEGESFFHMDLQFITYLLKCLRAMDRREVNLSAWGAGAAVSGTSVRGSGARGALYSRGGCPRGLISNNRVLSGCLIQLGLFPELNPAGSSWQEWSPRAMLGDDFSSWWGQWGFRSGCWRRGCSGRHPSLSLGA